jgi:hypothetical protein
LIFSEFYGQGAAMGWNPEMVDNTGLWEFVSAVGGFNKFHGGGEQSKPPTPDEHDALIAKYA